MVDTKLIGVKELQKWASMTVKKMDKDVNKAVNKASKDLVKRASTYADVRNHQTITNGIKSDVDIKGGVKTLTFYIDENENGILLPSKRYGLWNLAWGYNDGTYGRYDRGLISPSANTIGAVEGVKGLKHTDFMGRSWKANIPKLEKKLEDIIIRLK